VGVAAALSISVTVVWFPGVLYCYQRAPLRLRDLLSVLWRPALASIAAGAALFGATRLVSLDVNLGIYLVLSLFAFVALYIIVFLMLPNGTRVARELASLIRSLPQGGLSGS
jgi:hypothetical protein